MNKKSEKFLLIGLIIVVLLCGIFIGTNININEDKNISCEQSEQLWEKVGEINGKTIVRIKDDS